MTHIPIAPDSADRWNSNPLPESASTWDGPAWRKPMITPEPHKGKSPSFRVFRSAPSRHKTFCLPVWGSRKKEYKIPTVYMHKADGHGNEYRFYGEPQPVYAHLDLLFEHLLLFLPFGDLYCARRVNKFWKWAIDNAPKIRQALFLHPVAPCHAFAHQPNAGAVLAERRASFWTTSQTEVDRHEYITVFSNPLLHKHSQFFNPRSAPKYPRDATVFRQKFGHMLATQPPMARIELRDLERASVVQLKLADYHPAHMGVTLGQLCLMALAQPQRHRRRSNRYFTAFGQLQRVQCGHELDIVREEFGVRQGGGKLSDWRMARDIETAKKSDAARRERQRLRDEGIVKWEGMLQMGKQVAERQRDSLRQVGSRSCLQQAAEEQAYRRRTDGDDMTCDLGGLH